MIGASTSLIFNPIQKITHREQMTWKDSAKGAVIGGTVGAVTGPISNFN